MLRPAAEALRGRRASTPVVLAEKEGLALINGTDGMLGMLVLALHDLDSLVTRRRHHGGDERRGLLGTDDVFADDLQRLRPHPARSPRAANLRALMAGSEIREPPRPTACTRVQDAYSLRCSPQVAGGGPRHDGARRAGGRRRARLGDRQPRRHPGRPGRVNGNFHGAPIAYVLDFLAIVVADLASIAERRTDRFLDRARSNGLNAFLADDPGVDSGHMIAQYTQAAIVSELKRLAVPASVDSIPSSAMQEDHVSMGWSAARKLRRASTG